jgi:N utilization substance protein A
LTGWRLDIVSESRFKQIEEEAMAALSRVSTDEDLSRSLYRMGFRSLDEVVEASESELASVPGISANDVARFREQAATAMEEQRLEALAAMADRTEAPLERDKLLLVRGVNARMADQLDQSGYGSVQAIAAEEDTDRFAIKTGLGAIKAHALKRAVADFIATEWPTVEAKMLKSIAAAQAEARRLEAEAASAAQAASAEIEADTGSETPMGPEGEAGTASGMESEEIR